MTMKLALPRAARAMLLAVNWVKVMLRGTAAWSLSVMVASLVSALRLARAALTAGVVSVMENPATWLSACSAAAARTGAPVTTSP